MYNIFSLPTFRELNYLLGIYRYYHYHNEKHHNKLIGTYYLNNIMFCIKCQWRDGTRVTITIETAMVCIRIVCQLISSKERSTIKKNSANINNEKHANRIRNHYAHHKNVIQDFVLIRNM